MGPGRASGLPQWPTQAEPLFLLSYSPKQRETSPHVRAEDHESPWTPPERGQPAGSLYQRRYSTHAPEDSGAPLPCSHSVSQQQDTLARVFTLPSTLSSPSQMGSVLLCFFN